MSDGTQPVSLSEVEQAIASHADAFDQERLKRARAAEAQRQKRARRTERQFWFLFAFLILAFVLLAYRTETNNDLLREQAHATDVRFYQACLVRQDRQVQANIARETLVQVAADRKDPPFPTPEAREAYVAQLRQALLVLVEDCGVAPSPLS